MEIDFAHQEKRQVQLVSNQLVLVVTLSLVKGTAKSITVLQNCQSQEAKSHNVA